MTNKNRLSSAQFMDRFLRRIAIATFLISVYLGLTVVMEYVSGVTADRIDMATLALGIIAVILVVPSLLLYKIKYPGSRLQPDSFVADAYRQATERSFGLTFIFLVLLGTWANNDPAPFTASIAINATLALSLAIFSVNFFYLTRPVAGEEDDDFDREKGA